MNDAEWKQCFHMTNLPGFVGVPFKSSGYYVQDYNREAKHVYFNLDFIQIGR